MDNSVEHQISAGKITDGKLCYEKQIGTCYYENHDTKPFYRVSFWQFPDNWYYLVKNKDGAKYTVFSRIREHDDEQPTFQCPVGYAYTNSNLENFIQLQLNFPWQRCFISLFPSN